MFRVSKNTRFFVRVFLEGVSDCRSLQGPFPSSCHAQHVDPPTEAFYYPISSNNITVP